MLFSEQALLLTGLIWDYMYKETAPTTFSVDLELKNFYFVKRSTKQPRRLVQQEVHTTLKTVVEERVPSLFFKLISFRRAILTA